MPDASRYEHLSNDALLDSAVVAWNGIADRLAKLSVEPPNDDGTRASGERRERLRVVGPATRPVTLAEAA